MCQGTVIIFYNCYYNRYVQWKPNKNNHIYLKNSNNACLFMELI